MIKDYQSIRFMDSSHMRIEMAEYDIFLKGENFEIDYYDNSELTMKGKIKVIECHENRI